jgi:cytochrome c oxidase subunit 2
MSKIDRYSSRLAIVGLALLLVLLAVGCDSSNNQSTFDTAGPVARSQLTLFYWIFWTAVLVFIVVEGILIYAAIKFRRKPGDPDPEQTHGNTPLEIGWTVAPALILAVVAVPTVTTIFDNANSPDPISMTKDGLCPTETSGAAASCIDVVGHQWWWEFRYPHPDGSDAKMVASNELHIPVDEVINISLNSKDVLHSFWIPKIAGKVDLVPNHPNQMWILAEEPGEYYGQCAEFCGVAHSNMRFRVIAHPQEEFDAWLTAQAQDAAVPTDPLAIAGKNLFEGDARCWSCHTVEGSTRARGEQGPNLTHVASRNHIAAGIMENTQANLRKWLEDPAAVKPGNLMARDAEVYNDPARELTEADISALVAYLRGLK